MEAQLKSSAKQKRNSQSMKGMHIRDQIIQNKTKVGKTQIKIEDKDGVDWFIQKFIDPVKNSSGFQLHQAKKAQLQQMGIMPLTLEDNIREMEISRSIG